ncbi:MAG: hypothetical protein ACTHN8_01010 [Angustibacter sp.]
MDHEDRLSELLASYRAPEPLLAALEQHEQPDAAAGQLWRARVDRTALLVLVLTEFTGGAGDVVVATPGESPPADSAIDHLVEPTEVFGRLTLWPGLRGRLHQRVLDKLIERSDTTARLSAEVVAHDHDPAVPVAPHDPGAELLAELRDEFQTLQAAPGVPLRAADVPKLASVLPGDARTQLTTVMNRLGVSQQTAMQLLRGLSELTSAQANMLEQELGLPTGSLPATGGLDKDLALEVEHPRWRDAARRRAAHLGVSEFQGRISLAAEAYALAARESTTTPDWRQRLAIIVAGQS